MWGRHIEELEGFITEMCSFIMMYVYIPSIINIGSDIGKFMGEDTQIYKQTDYTDNKMIS
jgi:hypothetical protein